MTLSLKMYVMNHYAITLILKKRYQKISVLYCPGREGLRFRFIQTTNIMHRLTPLLLLFLALSAIDAIPSKLARFDENATKLKELLRKGQQYLEGTCS